MDDLITPKRLLAAGWCSDLPGASWWPRDEGKGRVLLEPTYDDAVWKLTGTTERDGAGLRVFGLVLGWDELERACEYLAAPVGDRRPVALVLA